LYEREPIMIRTQASSPQAQKSYEIVSHLQNYFVSKLNEIGEKDFEAVEWFRDEGKHGGGVRYESRDENIFNRASVNVSQVHYDNDASKKLSSASAISTIIHPVNPHAPSMHMHISWTQMRDGKGYWRIMADLNPSIPNDEDKKAFFQMLQTAIPAHYEEGVAQGDRYFFIPALDRHRGVSHFYLENFNTGDEKADERLAQSVGEAVIDTYISILKNALSSHPNITHEEKQKQLDYHTLYFFQVLTLDRGTTSGLLIHNQNDVGILGSLPLHMQRDLLESWKVKMPDVQQKLLERILDALPLTSVASINQEVKKDLACAVREHYKQHPEALSLQASGNIIPPTVENHK